MKRLNGYKKRWVLVGLVAALVLGGGPSAKADFTFGKPMNLGPPVNSGYSETGPTISADGLELYFESDRPIPGLDPRNLWVVTRQTQDDDWSEPVPLGPEINSASEDGWPQISPDGLELYFSAKRPDRYGLFDIWVTTRPTRDAPWGPPWNPGPPLNTAYADCLPSISADGRWLYLSDFWWGSQQDVRPGGYGSNDLWKAPIVPIVDFNGDCVVNSADMCIMVDHWGEDYSLCDIGPTPWGDGVVDVEDLIVLAEHLFEEIFPVELVAYWKLDETEGDITYNSIGDNHGILSGNPTWQPDAGQVAGALEFDGVNDYISTDFVLNPEDGTFSVFAWIKGGAPGQVIISQTNSTFGSDSTWLGADSSGGNLMTGLVPPPGGRSVPQPLVSEIVVIDNQWHLIGLVWDGSIRALYVDGIEVAKDTQAKLEGSVGGLHIGADSNLEVGTFFSGLIDDVRIYDVALSAEKIEALAH